MTARCLPACAVVIHCVWTSRLGSVMQVLRKFSTSLRERAVIATTATPGFTPTPNDRNRAMLEEAGAFSSQMRRMEQDLRTLSQAAQASAQVAVETTLQAVAAPLPTVYHTTKAGSAALAAPAGVVRKSSIGDGHCFDGFSVVVEEHHKRLADALEPMLDWQGAYAALKVECRAVEEMRRGLDYRLVQVSSMQSKVDRLEAKVAELTAQFEQPEKAPGEGAPPSSSTALNKAQDSLEGLQFTLHHKEAKLTVATEQYKQAEEGLYSKLVGLLEKASEFRNQAALALNLAASMLAQTSRKVAGGVPSKNSGAAAATTAAATAGVVSPVVMEENPAFVPAPASPSREVCGTEPEAAATKDAAALGTKVPLTSNPLYNLVASA